MGSSQIGVLMMLVAFRKNKQHLFSSKKEENVSTVRSPAKQDAHYHDLVVGVY